MERLTQRVKDGILVKESHGENSIKTLYQCFGDKPNENYSNCEEGYCAMEKLADYEDTEEKGLLLRLPCRIGDIIYHNGYGFPCGCTVDSISLDSNGMAFHAKNHDGSTTMSFSENELGKSVFFSLEEAEAKLAEMRGKQHE